MYESVIAAQQHGKRDHGFMSYAKIKDRRAASKRNYYENKKAYIEKSKARKRRLYAEVITPAKDKPCADCGQKFLLVCMDFDHVRGKKKFEIGSGFDRVPMKELLKEISKCDVVCANCHRVRTSKRVSEADSSNR
jgi:hypothetical protein